MELDRGQQRMVLALAALVVAGLALSPITTLAQVVTERLWFPLDLEWMEGGQLLHAQRLLADESIYGPCDHGFIAYPYPPVHFGLLALLGAVAGLGYPLGRALSVAALLVSAGLLSWQVAVRAPSRATAALGALLSFAAIAAGFPTLDGWYDLVRVDGVQLAFVLIAATLALPRGTLSRRRALAAGLVMALAVFTKQSAIVFVPWLYWIMWRQRRVAALSSALVTLLLGLLALSVLQYTTGGWYWRYVFEVMGRHPLSAKLGLHALLVFVAYAPFLPLTLALAAYAWRRGWLSRGSGGWLSLWLLSIPQSLLAASKVGGHVNNLMPAVVLAGPLTLMVCADVWRRLRLRRDLWPLSLALMGLLLVAACLRHWRFDAAAHLPSATQWREAAALHQRAAQLDGTLIAPNQPYLPAMHGLGLDQPIAQAYYDVLNQPGLDPHACMQQTEADFALLSTAPTSLLRGLLFSRFDHIRPGHFQGPKTQLGYRTAAQRLLRARPRPERVAERIVFDFESSAPAGSGLADWTLTGDAFAAPLGAAKASFGSVGEQLLHSGASERGDAATGLAHSPRFVLDRDRLSLLVGGANQKVSVSLQVAGRTVARAWGERSSILIPILWDVQRHRGKRAVLVVRDANARAGGSIQVDQVTLFDVAESP